MISGKQRACSERDGGVWEGVVGWNNGSGGGSYLKGGGLEVYVTLSMH